MIAISILKDMERTKECDAKSKPIINQIKFQSTKSDVNKMMFFLVKLKIDFVEHARRKPES